MRYVFAVDNAYDESYTHAMVKAVHNPPTNREPCTVEYAYDHQGRMVWKQVSANAVVLSTRTLLWDGWNIVQEKIANQQSTITNYYTWGLDLSGSLQGAGGVGGLLAVTTVSNPGTLEPLNPETFFPCFDANGNVTEYTDDSGAIAAHYEYDPFGNTVVQSGPMSDSFTHRFSTKPWCAVTGLSEYLFRKYSPGMGRWLSRDPVGENGGLKLYGFVENDLVNKCDYLGLWSFTGCCSGTKYNKLTKCCCCNGKVNDGSNGYLLNRKKIVTGIRKCNIAGYKNPSGYPHGWLEVDLFSAGFVPGSIENGAQGHVNIPDARLGGLCSDIKLDPCKYNIETVKQAVKQLSIASRLFPPPYSRKGSNFFVCYTWRDEIINRAKEMGKNKCGTSNTTIELYE